MIVISDTSVLSNLIKLGEEELLAKLFGSVIIPKAVWEELTHLPELEKVLSELPWLEVRELSDRTLFEELTHRLDRGESEAIALAKEISASLLLIDEKKGRRVAQLMGLEIIGLIGVLIEAKVGGHINLVKPKIDKLIFEYGFRVQPALVLQNIENYRGRVTTTLLGKSTAI